MNAITANYDESWKEALSEYFDSFLDFFFSPIYQQIDWTKIPQALDKELQQITASSDKYLCKINYILTPKIVKNFFEVIS
jgi:secreted Zn-dependent insulinase-like peptidase